MQIFIYFQTDIKHSSMPLPDSDETQCSECGLKPLKDVRYKSLFDGKDICPQCIKLSTPLDDVSVVYVKLNKAPPASLVIPKIGHQIPASQKYVRGK